MSEIDKIEMTAEEIEKSKSDPYTSWAYNVVDKYKPMDQKSIVEDLKKNLTQLSVMMGQVQQDFNFSATIRLCNHMGSDVYYYGKRKYDRRGTCGTHHYTNVKYLSSEEEIFKLKEEFMFIALEQNKRSISLKDFKWPMNKKIMLIVGEEGPGVSDELIAQCEHIIEIPNRGSVRSLNVSNATAMALWSYTSQVQE